MPDFQVFTRRSRPPTTEPEITVQKAGPLTLNRAAYDALGGPEAVELLYDPDEKVIGVRAVVKDALNAYPVRSLGSQSYQISARALMKYYSISLDDSRRYPAHLYDDVLGVDLKAEGVVVTSNRNGRNGKGHGGGQSP